ncbi:MAG: ribonuclease III [Peptococcaceae bacterium]|jgi:ribonuclease-3|nr:ribonuclease III [Peptococcaceae bacterium]
MSGIPDLIKTLKLDQLEGAVLQEDILGQAFLHPSYCMENPRDTSISPYLESYQRLEFLGDAILGYLAAQKLYRDNPLRLEGELTKMRASIVCEKSLAAAATVLGLGRWLQLGKGITATGGADQPSLLADTFEALLGALYLSGATMAALEGFVFRAIEDSRYLVDSDMDEDYKGQLQAWVQKTNDRKLSYAIIDEKGPDHRKSFLAAAYLDEDEVGRGWGNSKQEAQKLAAKRALQQIVE